MNNKEILLKRGKSLGWRAGMMILALLVDFALVNLELFDMSPMVVTVVGLLLGEVSKYLNVDVAKLKGAVVVE